VTVTLPKPLDEVVSHHDQPMVSIGVPIGKQLETQHRAT
jgi:hypothetical protein